jgi:hypothetical protein
MHHQCAITMTKLHQSMGEVSSHQGGGPSARSGLL